jgi:hypothetical protein
MADPRHTGRKMIRERATKTLVSLLPGERPHPRSEHERDVLVDDTGRDMSSFLSKAPVFGGDKRSQRPNVSGPMILYPHLAVGLPLSKGEPQTSVFERSGTQQACQVRKTGGA